jgi:MinD-like ATPase involved in chromosome partitioning or flagellar assembly
MHFKTISTPKPRTPKQNAQEAQTPTEAPATVTTTAATTATTTAAIIVTTIAATTAITTAATTAIIKKAKGKAKGRALLLERWHKRLGHFNYADVKQLATYNSQIKLANNKELFCESCAYGK